MFLVEFLKSGSLNKFQFITCTILLIILYFTLNTMTNGISSAWGQLLIYGIMLLFSLLVIARLRECKSKQPIKYGFIVTTPIYTAYIVSFFILFKYRIRNCYLYSISNICINPVFLLSIKKMNDVVSIISI